MVGLDLDLLGSFRAAVDGVTIDDQRWSRKKARVLVKVLALAPGRKIHREQLIDILWPDADADLALNNLHKVIHAARRALEPELTQGSQSRFIQTVETQIILSMAGGRVDVDQFESQAAEALRARDTDKLKAALALYQGDLLEEDLYEDWSSVRRERLRLICQRVLEALASNYEAAHDEGAIDLLHRLLGSNPANEEAHRRLMRFYAARGQRHLALEQYQMCSDALHKELNAAPEAATIQLYEGILAGAPASPAHEPAATPLTASGVTSFPAELPRRKFAKVLLIAGLAAVALSATVYYWVSATRPSPATALAILPLRTRTGGEQMEYIADGMTDALITSASRLPGLKVMARSTVFVYKGRTDSREVGRELKVSHVLSGRLDQQGDTVTVGVELVDVADGSRIWARLYSVQAKDVSGVQQLLNTDLSTALQVKLTEGERKQQALPTTGDAEAYRLYLTGRHFWNQRTAAAFQKSIGYYQQAIARDPNYALAYAGLADSYGLLGFQSGLPSDYFPKARDAAAKALQLNEFLAEAQTSLAMVSALYDWNWAAAEAQFRRAIDLNPGYATAHHWFGVHLSAMGRFDEAQRELDQALGLDPLSPIVNLNAGYPALYQRRYEQALEVFGHVLELNPMFPPAHEDRMTVFEILNRPDDAGVEAVAWLKADGPPGLAEAVGDSFKKGDYKAGLRAWLGAYENGSVTGYVSPVKLAVLAVRLDDFDRAFSYFNRAMDQRCPQLVYAGVDPKYGKIRQDPRFTSLLKRIGLK